MNHIYRLIWNAELLRWSVVPESAKRHGKPSSTTRTARHQGRDGFSPNRHDSASHVPPAWRWKPALCYLLAFQQLMVPTLASAQAIVADGRTATAVSTTGSVTNVTTGTVRANNAFNSFSVFNVAQGTTANLFLPNGTLNLINLVRDQRTTIDGMLNAIKDGKIGGNVYFANPNGFLVSQSGVVNVGSLSLSTPTAAYIDSFFNSPGNPNDAAVASLLSGTAPRNAALISILGQINAIDSISLSAGAINVGGSLYAGARFIGNAPNFTDVVNANGLVSANNVVMKEGRIEIVADNDVTVSGTIATPGGSGVRGGDIAIWAGGNVDLQSGSVISSRGNGDNSAGGTVNIWADGNAVTRQGALVDASAGLSGNGGAIEFSAKNTVELAGGEFRADGMGGGLGGSVLIDPTNLLVSADILRGSAGYGVLPDGASSAGANLTLQADETITVNNNVTISTRSVNGTTATAHATENSTGNSGNLTLLSETITLKSGSKLLAGTETGSIYSGGDVTLTASNTSSIPAIPVISGISIDNATITGRNVSLTATSSYDDSILTSWLPIAVPVVTSTIDVNSSTLKASGTLNLSASSLIDVNTTGLSPIGSITAVSTSTVDVHGTSVLTAGGNTTLASNSTVTSKATPGGPNLVTLPGDAGVAINVVVSTAKTHVGDSSSVTATGGTLDLTAKNTVTATTTADSSAGGAVAVGGTVALSEVTSVTRALIDGSATTNATALTVSAESSNTVTTSAKAASKGATKQTADEKAAAPSKSEETLAKYKDQVTTSDGAVDVAAAIAIANVNSITLADIASTGTQTATGAATVSSKAASSSTVTADGSSASGSVGVGAAVGVNVGVLVNEARVADNANVSSNGLTVSATLPTGTTNSFVTTATSGAGASNVGVAGALGTNVLVNTTVATIEGNTDGVGNGAVVNSNGGDVVVESANTSESKLTVGASVKPASGSDPAAVGVGASVGMNVAVDTTVAEIGDGAAVSGANNLDLTATGSHTLTNSVTGGATGANISVTPVAAITVAVNTTTARLGTGSQLDLLGAYTSSAEQTSSSTTTATGQTQGNNVAVGASIALNNATDTVTAEIDRDISATGDVAVGAKSTAKSSASATASVSGGEKATTTDTPPAKSDGSAGQTVDEKVTAQGAAAKTAGKKTADSAAANSPTSAGLSVASATGDSKSKLDSTQDAPKTEDNSQGSGGVSVAAAVGVNAAVATTTASVAKNRKITSTGGALKVTSVNQTDASAKADGSQVDSGNTNVGVGAAVALNVGISTNVAVVGENADIDTQGLTISAKNATGEKSDYAAEAKSGAGAGNVGVAGSLAANVAVNTTVAALEGDSTSDADSVGATVKANGGDILIEAANATTNTVKSGADVKGTGSSAAVGVGASIGANIGVNTTVADIGDQAVITGGKNLGLNATAYHTYTTDVTGGASGTKVAVTPLAAVTVAVNTTTAHLGESATDIGISGAYSSTAQQTSGATTTATGQTSGSNVAVGASIGLTVATDTVTAAIDRNVSATEGVEVNAKSTAKSSTTATASVAGGEKAKDDGTAPAADGGSGSGQSVDQKVTAQGDAAKASGKKTATKAPATTPAAGSTASDKLDTTTPPPKTEDTTESGGVAVAAAVGINTGVATTTATVGKNLKISSTNGALKVTSVNETDASAKAEGSQVDNGNTNVGVGAAVALNVGISTNVAAVGENAEINTKGLTISAVNATGEKSDYAAEAKSGAGASNVGVAGSLAANIVVNTTVAALEGDSTDDTDTKGAIVNAHGGDILIEAANATTSAVKSGADVKGTDSSAAVGVGASIGMNIGVNTVVAEAGNGSEITNGKDFGLNAKADHTFTTDVTGGAAGAKVAVTPLAAVTVAVNTTTARLGESPVETNLSGKYSSTAEHNSSVTTTATGQTAGSNVAVGVSIGLSAAVDTVTADVERDINATNGVEVNAKSTAKSSTSATASVSGGDKAKDDGSAPAADGGSGSGQTVDDKVAGQQDKATAAGKTTAAKAPATTPAAGGTASSKLDTNKQTPPKGETSEGGVSVAAAVGVNVGVATTSARIGEGKKITSSAGALKVTSANQTDTSAKADGSQVDSAKSTAVGVGAAVALNVGVATTTAVVADDANVSTKGLTISATGISGEKSDSSAEAKSGAGAGNVGVAGSLAINSATNTTVALLEGNTDGDANVAKVDAHGGDVLIEAQNATTSAVKVSADVKGTDDKAKVGVGASVGVNVGVNTTVAEIGDNSEVTNAGNSADSHVYLNATANHAMTTDVTGGAAGAKVSVTPVVAASIAVNTTSARLGTGATKLDVTGAYSSTAEQTSTVTTKATGQAQGDVAVGASLGATIEVDNVSATVERNLDASNGIALAASSDTSLTTEVKAGAKGAKAAKTDTNGNETPEAGTTVDEQKKNQLDFAKSRNSNAASVSTDTPEAKTPDTTEQTPSTDKPTSPPTNEKQGKKVSVAAAIGATVAYNQAKAEIAAGKTVGAGTGKLKVSSTTDTNYRTLATGEAVSDDVGVAAAVALTATYNKTQANIGSGATVSDAGDIEISATSRQNRGTDFQKTMSAEAVSGASGGEVAVAGALAAVGNWNETRASIDEGVTIGTSGAPVGDVTVQSDETSKVAAQARAGALSTGDKSKAGVGASFAVLLSYNQNTAAVGYDANKNSSYLPTSIFADSLSVTATKNRVWFLTPTLADAKNFVTDDIKNLNFDALDPSTYLGSNNYYTEAVAGAAAKGNAAVAGAFAVNIFGNTTEAYLADAVSLTTSGKQPSGEQLGVEVTAHSDTQAVSFTGGVAGAKKAGVGISATSIVSLDQTLATIGNAVIKSNADGAGIKVDAYARQDIANIGVGAAAATEGAGVTGVLGAIVSLAKTEAKIADNAEVKSQGDVDVTATSDLTAVSVSGGVAAGKSAGVGASIAANVLANETRAEIGDNAKVTAKNNLNVAADADEVAITAVVAGAGGEKAGVAGALSANVIVGDTEAVISQGAQINTDTAYGSAVQNVALTAHDDTVVVGISGGGAGGGKAGVGAALDTTVLVKTVKAIIEDDADGLNVANVNADRNVQIDASATETITSVSMGFAGGGTAGVGGAVSVAVNKNDVEAGIGKSAKVDSNGNVLINAQDDVTAVLLAGAGAGGGDAGVGGSLAVATLLETTKAYVADNATVNARGNADAATVYSGDTVFSDTDNSPSAFLAKKTESAKGLSVIAYNRENLITTVIAGAGGGTAGVAATVSANVIASGAEASIGQNAKINAVTDNDTVASAEQQVRVKAVDEALLIDSALAAAGGGTAGVGGTGNVGVLVKTTTAKVGKGADIKARQAFELTAASSDVTVAPTVGIAGGGTAGVGGALGATAVANTTQAYVEDGTSATDRAKISVSGGNLKVSADEFSSSWITVGTGVGGGTAGVGGALAVGVNASTTMARIGNYTETDASGTTSVTANSTENVNSIAIAGGGGGAAGVVGSIALDVVISKTEAGIGEHAKVNQNTAITSADQSVDVSATDRVISVAAAGSGAGGGTAGVGGSATVTVALNTTSAYIDDNAEVSAAKDIGVHAWSDKYINSATFAGTGGGAAGVAGGVSILAIGSLFDGDAKSGLQSTDSDGNSTTTQANADKTTGASQVGGALGDSKQSNETKLYLDDKTKTNLAVSKSMSDSADVPLQNTQAFIGYGATVKAGRDVAVTAKDTTLAINANGAGAGGGAAGVAGSLGVTLLHDSAEAFIANQAKVDAGRTLSVNAETGEIVVNIGVTGYGGGAAGVGGSAAVNVVTSSTSAYIGDADINQDTTTSTERSVEVTADSNSNLIAVAGSGGGAGAAAVGGVLNVNTLVKSTQAFIGEGATVAADDNVIVDAKSAQNIISAGISIQGAGAAAVGGAATVNVVANTTEAYIGSSRDDTTKTAATVDSDGNVVVAASDDTLLIAVSGSGTGAGAAAVGGAVAANVISSQTRAYVGDNSVVNARGNAAGTTVDTGTIDNTTASAMPALPSGVSANVDADRDGVNDGDLSSGASFTLAGGSTSTGVNPSSAKDSNGNSIGSAQGGLGTKGTETAKGLSITATGNEKIVSAAMGVAGAGAAGVTGTATADIIISTIEAGIGNGAQINQSGTVGSNSDVRVRAADNTFAVMASGTVAGGGAAGVSGSANVAVVAKNTHATIGDADVKASNVQVKANSAEDIYVIDANVSFGIAGVGGAAGVAVVTNDTQAGIAGGATINAAGGIGVKAEEDTSLDIYTLAGSAGVGAVSGAVSVGVIDNTTRAYVGSGTSASTGATLDAGGLTEISADSHEQITTGTASAAGGGGGFAGAVGVKVVTSKTTAEIGDYARINQTTRGGATQDVKVSATDDVKLWGFGGSGAVGSLFGAGAAAEINVVRNTTTASLGDNAKLRADNNVSIAASSTKDVTASAAALAGGGSVGIAGAVALAFVGASIQSDDDAKSGIGDGSTASMADEKMKSDNVASKLGSDEHVQGTKSQITTRTSTLGVSGELNDSSTSSRDKTQAFVGHDSEVVSGGNIDVTATDKTQITLTTVGAGFGFAGIGGAIGVGITNSTTEAYVDDRSIIDATGKATVLARSTNVDGNGSQVNSGAGAGGVVGASAAVAVLDDTSTTRAYVGDDIDVQQAATFAVTAETNRKSSTITAGANAGALAIGASVARTTFTGTTEATIGNDATIGKTSGKDVGFVTVAATDTSTGSALATAGSAGIYAGSGADAKATITSDVTAGIGANADITAQDDVSVTATATPGTQASAYGVNVGAAAAGLSFATANVTSHVDASLGTNSTVEADNLDVAAYNKLSSTGYTAKTYALGASGGLIGATGTDAESTFNGTTHATIGDGSTITGNTSVDAGTYTRQRADATGFVVGGYLALGANLATATSNTETLATTGNNVSTSGGDVSITADGQDDNSAGAIAGSGGLIAGAAAKAKTSSTSQTDAHTGGGDASHIMGADTFTLSASHRTLFNGEVDSVQASLAGASGAWAEHSVSSKVNAELGDTVRVTAGQVDIDASNTIRKDWLNGATSGDDADWNIRSGSGGAINAPAGKTVSHVEAETNAAVGDNAVVHVLALSGNPGQFTMDATNTIVGHDKSKLDSGGAIALANSAADFYVDKSETNATIGSGTHITNDEGNIAVGTQVLVDIDVRSAADTYGLAGAPMGHAYANYTGAHTVTVNSGAELLADDGTISLAAGQSSSGASSVIKANSTVNLWNKTAIPINSTPDAQSNVENNATLEILGSTTQVLASGDISLTADRTGVTTYAHGIGKDIYREAAAAIASGISNLFGGGDVSFDITGGSTSSTGTSTARVDGTVMTGIHRNASLTLDYALDCTNTDCRDPSTGLVQWKLLVSKTDNVSYTIDPSVGIGDAILARIAKLTKLLTDYAADPVAAGAYQSEIAFLEHQLIALGIGHIDSSTGKIIYSTTFNNPSPRQTIEKAVVSNVTNATLQQTALTGDPSNMAATSTVGTVLTDYATIKANNSSIQTNLTSLSGYASASTGQQTLYSDMVAAMNRSNAATDPSVVDSIAYLKAENLSLQSLIASKSSTINTLASKTTRTATDNATMTTLSGEIRTLLNTIATNDESIATKTTALSTDLASINTAQATLRNVWSSNSTADQTTVTAINTARNNNTTPITSIASAVTTLNNAYDTYFDPTPTTTPGSVISPTFTQLASDLYSQLSATGSSALSDVAASGPIANYVKVGDIRVELGSIRVKADNLIGSGSLQAPGDAKITIENYTPNFLTLGNLTIDSASGGFVTLNNVQVNNNTDINRVNASKGGANFSDILTADSAGATPPSITVASYYNPNANPAPSVPAPSPDIELAGDISNPRGSVTVTSKAGSIYVDGTIHAASVNVKADNGDFVQSYVNGFNAIAGDPADNVQGGSSTQPAGDGIVANGDVFISARYLNINGLVQSGQTNFHLDLPDPSVLMVTATADQLGLTAAQKTQITNATTDLYFTNDCGSACSGMQIRYNLAKDRLEVSKAFIDAYAQTDEGKAHKTVNPGIYTIIADSSNIGASYDVINQQFYVDGTQVKGGYIQLYGQILNTATSGAILRALDGFGQIAITNATGLPVIVGLLDAGADPSGTGRGTQGTIDITDVQGVIPGSGTTAPSMMTIHSVITRNGSNVMLDQTGAWNADGTFNAAYHYAGAADGSSGTQTTQTTDSRNASYNPQTGLRYVWTTAQDSSTTYNWEFSGAQFFGISALRTQPTGSVVSKDGPYYSTGQRLADGTYVSSTSNHQNYIAQYNDVTGNGDIAYYNATNKSANVVQNDQTYSTGDYWTKTAEWTNCNWWTLCIAQDYHSTWTELIPNTTVSTHSLKADNPIAIQFSGADTGSISINSKTSVVLTGAINNRSGTTTITAGVDPGSNSALVSAGQSIVQTNDSALIATKDLVLKASGSVGGTLDPLVDANAIRVAMTGTLNAAATDGNVRINQTLGDLKVGTVTASGSSPDGSSRIYLDADGNILAASTASKIEADRVELVSEHGAIGSIATPLLVNTGYTDDTTKRVYYGLKASAYGDIGIESGTWSGNTDGNLLVDTVVSTAGDVKLVAPGRIIDNNPIESVDRRTWTQLLAYWDSLALRQGTTENALKQQQAVTSFENGKTADYQLYWQLRNRQADPSVYDPSFTYTATTAERAALTASGMTAAEITQFEANRTTQYHSLNASVGSLNGGSYDSTYRYAATSEDLYGHVDTTDSSKSTLGILTKSSWTDRELAISISPGLLKTITDTNPIVKSANVQGKTVTLQAGIAIGETSGTMSIPTNIDPSALTPEEKVALATAERSDIDITDSLITVKQRRPLNFEAENAINVIVTPATSSHPDNGMAFLASQGDGLLGIVNVPGETRFKVQGSLVNATINSNPLPSGEVSLVQTGNLVLEAADGGIGYIPARGTSAAVSQPMQIDLHSGATLTARANDDADIIESGDMKVDTVYSRANAKLTANANGSESGSITDAFADSELNILANNINLYAAGAIGSLGNPLDVGVQLVSDDTTQRTNLGRIYATSGSGQGVFLNGPLGTYFNIGGVSSGDAVALTADNAMLIDGTVSGPGPFKLISGGTTTMTPWAFVHATNLGVYLKADSLVMQDAQRMADNGETLDPKYVPGTDAAHMLVDIGTIDIATTGDAAITGIETGNGTASAIRVVSSAGHIIDNGDTRLDIIADTPPAAQLTISAPLGIGANPLDVRLLNLQATSDAGVVDLAVQNSVNIVSVTAGDRVLITAGGDITGNSVTSTGTASGTDPSNPATGVILTSTGGSVDLNNVSSAQGVNISAPNAVTVDQVTLGGALNLASNQIAASVTGTGSGVHYGTIGGYGGGPASSVNLLLSSPTAFHFTSFSTLNGAVNVAQGEFWSDSTYVGQRLTLSNPQIDVLVDQLNRGVQGYDVQLYTGGSTFNLGLVTNHVYTDALAIFRDSQAEIISPNGNNSSAVEQGNEVTNRNHKLNGLLEEPEVVIGDNDDNVSYRAPAVALDENNEQCPEGSADCEKK